MLNSMKLYADDFLSWRPINGFAENRSQSNEIDPWGRGKFAEIRRRSHWPSFLHTSSRVRSGFGGLPYSRSGLPERQPSIIGDCEFFGYFFQIYSPHGADSPFQTERAHILDILVVTSYMRIRRKIERIEGNRTFRVGKVRRNPARTALAKFFPTSSRVRTGLSELPCSRSGRSEKRPSMIGERASFGYFFIFLAPTVRLPLFKRSAHTHKKVDSSLVI